MLYIALIKRTVSDTVFLLFSVFFAAQLSFIYDAKANFGGTLGTSYEFGQLGNSNLQDRSLTAFSVEALPGSYINSKLLIGFNLNYRIQQQITSLKDTDGTNLKGKSWLVGVGVQYHINDTWALQTALDFVGEYSFDQKTVSSKSGDLKNPIGLRVKGQYFFLEKWSADMSANYTRWSTFNVENMNVSKVSNQWMVGVGVTYHFRKSKSQDVAVAEQAKFTVTEKKYKLNSNLEESVTTQETKIKNSLGSSEFNEESPVSNSQQKSNVMAKYISDLPLATFTFGTDKLSVYLKNKIKELGALLVNNVEQKITLVGYTDNVGNEVFNKKLSKSRAENVKKLLIESGVPSDNIEVVGKGSQNPIRDNVTAAGRAFNRRVEILLR